MPQRQIHGHEINECNEAIEIYADEPAQGGASHQYNMVISSKGKNTVQTISFQNGPIKEVGTNGITHEALLAIITDRLEGFQSGEWKCRENALVITKLEEAMHWLQHRTKLRDERGVEGTHQV